MNNHSHPRKEPGWVFRLVLPLILVLAGPWQQGLAQKIPHQPTGTMASHDQFGRSVALSGDRALIGAVGDNYNRLEVGAAYVFERQADGAWSKTARLVPSDIAQLEGILEEFAFSLEFGHAVGISGPYAIVGAPFVPASGFGLTYMGAAYLFERQADGTWSETARLMPDAPFTQQNAFGYAVAISNERVLIANPEDDELGQNAGAAYVFERQPDGAWSRMARLTAGDAEPGDRFGSSVALLGDRALIGAAGAAYVFEQQADGSWSQATRLTAGDGDAAVGFGRSVALQGERALIGAAEDPDDMGSAYIFERQADGAWTETAKLTPGDGDPGDRFGASVALSGDRALVGAVHDEANGPSSGSSYVFEQQTDGAWTEIARLTAGDGDSGDEFGGAVVLQDEQALIGASRDDNNGKPDEGSAYVFTRQANGAWQETAQLTPGDTTAVLSFTLIDADTDQPVAGYNPIPEGATLDLAQLPPRLNIRANATGDTESVTFVGTFVSSPSGRRTENVAPYAVFGDVGGNYTAGTIPLGNHTLTATPYVADNPVGGIGGGVPLDLHLTVIKGDIGPLAVTRLVLVDADTDEDLFELEDDMFLWLDRLPPRLNVRADVNGPVASVRFVIDFPQRYQRTETVPPYALFGDTNGNYLPGTFDPLRSRQRLIATPFAKPGQRTPGTSLNYLLRIAGTPAAKMAVPTGTFVEGVNDAAETIPAAYALEANYPNPFNPSTVISFSLPEAAPVRVAVYDLLGRQVALLLDGPMPAGRHEVSFDGAGLSSGLYLYRLETPGQAFVRRMHLLK